MLMYTSQMTVKKCRRNGELSQVVAHRYFNNTLARPRGAYRRFQRFAAVSEPLSLWERAGVRVPWLAFVTL